MLKRIWMFVFIGALALSACSGMSASNKVEIRDAWIRPALKDSTSAAYMVIVNGTNVNHEMIGVASKIAKAVEMHMSQMDNGVMHMVQQQSIPLPAGQMVELKPGGLHIMFVGLKQDLKPGDTVELTLMFKDYENIKLTVPVKSGTDMNDMAPPTP